MPRAQILTPWTGDGSSPATAYRPRVVVDHQLQAWVDVTGQDATRLIPSPNALIIEATAADAVLAAIEADPNAEILWTEPNA